VAAVLPEQHPVGANSWHGDTLTRRLPPPAMAA
jgi:hypothetical protein